MSRRPYYKKTIYYDETFVQDIELFEKLIMHDSQLNQIKLQNDQQRFSIMMRILIRSYNRNHASISTPKVVVKEIKNETITKDK